MLASETLLETECFKKVYSNAETTKAGFIIKGSKGAGKTTSLHYLQHKLTVEKKENMVIWASSSLLHSCSPVWNSKVKDVLTPGKVNTVLF